MNEIQLQSQGAVSGAEWAPGGDGLWLSARSVGGVLLGEAPPELAGGAGGEGFTASRRATTPARLWYLNQFRHADQAGTGGPRALREMAPSADDQFRVSPAGTAGDAWCPRSDDDPMLQRFITAANDPDGSTEDAEAAMDAAATAGDTPFEIVLEAMHKLDGRGQLTLLAALGAFAAAHPTDAAIAFLASYLSAPSASRRLGATYGLEHLDSPRISGLLRAAAQDEPVAYIAALQRRMADTTERDAANGTPSPKIR